ncbi:transposase [Streptomyces sp. NBC_00728]|uniref:transposase n=1 Tax=Streptomyces sp. NBC_00728 TaxID=2903676 RepID=UPI003866BE66
MRADAVAWVGVQRKRSRPARTTTTTAQLHGSTRPRCSTGRRHWTAARCLEATPREPPLVHGPCALAVPRRASVTRGVPRAGDARRRTKPGGHPEKWSRREIVDGIRYIVDNGAKWRALPADSPPVGEGLAGSSGGGTGPGWSPPSVTSSATGSVPARAVAHLR